MNEKKIITALLAVLIVSNLVMGFFLLKQEKKINLLQSNRKDVQVGEQKRSLTDDEQKKMNDEQLQAFIASQNQISGMIKEISDDKIIMDAAILKFDDLKGKDLSKTSDISVEQKEITVKVNKDTSFEQIEKNKLKAGDIISVTVGVDSYGKDTVLAQRITKVDLPVVKSDLKPGIFKSTNSPAKN